MSRSPRRVTVLSVAFFSAIVVVGGIAASLLVDPAEPVELLFGQGDGLSTQGPGGPAGEGLDIVQDLAADYLAIAQPFTTFGFEFENPILTVGASGDATDAESVTLRVGGTELMVGGTLSQVPLAEIEALRQEIEAAGWDLLTSDDSDPVFIIDDEDHTYAAVFVHDDEGLVEVVILQTPGHDGLRIVANPWIVEKTDADGHLLDVLVRNPFHSASADLDTGDEVVIERIHCVEGRCVPYKHVRPLCDALPDCEHPGTVRLGGPDALSIGGHHEVPGTLLHVWSADYFHGGAGLSLLGAHEAAFAPPYWEGNPFSPEGLTIHDDNGPAANVQILLPTATEHRFALHLSGPVVAALDKDGAMGHEADLSEYRIQFDWGPLSVGTDALYGGLDAANALLVGSYHDADGQVVRAHLSPLVDPEPIVELLQTSAGDVRVLVGPVRAEVLARKAEIGLAADGALAAAGPLVQPATTAAFRLATLGQDQADVVISVAKGAAGCEDTLRGCIEMHIEATHSAATGAVPPLPDPDAERARLEGTIGGLPLPDTSVIDVAVNTVTGLVLASVPDLECTEPTTGLPTTGPGCDGTPDLEDAALAAVGLIGDTAGGLLFMPDPDSDVVAVYDPEGNTLLRVGRGDLDVAGTEAGFRNGHLIDLSVPGGPHICVDATFSPEDAARGAVPSATVGCDGIGGHTFVIQPGAMYEFDGNRLARLSVADPTDPGGYLLYYNDDGETTTIASGVLDVGAHTVPSALVEIAGNPVTSATWSIGLAGQTTAYEGPFERIEITKQLYADGRAVLSGLPPEADLGLVFALVEGPPSDIVVGSGDHRVGGAQGDLDGDAWVSGLRDQPFVVRTATDLVGERLDVVYRVGGDPRPGVDPRFPLPMVGYDQDGLNTYEGRLPAGSVSAFQEGAELRFLLAWTDRYGPVAVSRLDDNHGAGYAYRLDTKAPTASVSAPADSDAAAFDVAWSGVGPSGSGLDRFRVDVSEGPTAGSSAWTTWLDGVAAEDPRSATYAGSPGRHYWFRAQACDNAGNCGPWSAVVGTEVAPLAVPDAPVPSVSVVAPAPGATLTGLVPLRWDVAYDGDGTPVTTIDARPTGTGDWRPVYSGAGRDTTWDTSAWPDGPHDLRFSVRDGDDHDEALVPIILDNGHVQPSVDRLRERVGGVPVVGGEPVDDAGDASDKKGSPAPAVALVVLAAVAIVAARRVTARRP